MSQNPMAARTCAACTLVLETILQAIRDGSEWTCKESAGISEEPGRDQRTGERYIRHQPDGSHTITIRVPPTKDAAP